MSGKPSNTDIKNVKSIANAVGQYLFDRKKPTPEKFTFAISGYIDERGFMIFTNEYVINQKPFNDFVTALMQLDKPITSIPH